MQIQIIRSQYATKAIKQYQVITLAKEFVACAHEDRPATINMSIYDVKNAVELSAFVIVYFDEDLASVRFGSESECLTWQDAAVSAVKELGMDYTISEVQP